MLHNRETLESDVFVLPDLPSPERNWLMRHADLVLYPSSAEGFGLVPFEAARFGTPTLFTRFGPLQELAPDIPVAAEDWSPDTLAAVPVVCARVTRELPHSPQNHGEYKAFAAPGTGFAIRSHRNGPRRTDEL